MPADLLFSDSFQRVRCYPWAEHFINTIANWSEWNRYFQYAIDPLADTSIGSDLFPSHTQLFFEVLINKFALSWRDVGCWSSRTAVGSDICLSLASCAITASSWRSWPDRPVHLPAMRPAQRLECAHHISLFIFCCSEIPRPAECA
jgi:hypothetical protein